MTLEFAKANKIVTFKTGKLDSNAAVEGGKYPFFTCSQTTFAINSYAFDTECVLLAGNNASAIFPLKYYKGKFNAYQRTYVIETIDPTHLNIKYFYFFLRPFLKSFEQQATGATTKFLTIKILNNIDVALPEFETQKKIAAVLSAYDDLIENNKRRIALLEKMAEEIYREWFVRMRFPGHEKVKVVKGVPVDWDYDRASTFFSVVKGKSYGGDELTENPSYMPFITLKSFNRRGGYREDGLKYYSGRYKNDQIVRADDIVMAVTDMTQNREVVGRVAKVPNFGDRGAVISLDVIKIVPKKTTGAFLYSYLRFSGFAECIKEFANGANVLHLKSDLVTQQKINIPPMPLQQSFSEIVKPIYTQIDLLSGSNKTMTEMRDMLLPRLISGKLSVENLDIQFPPSMQDEATS